MKNHKRWYYLYIRAKYNFWKFYWWVKPPKRKPGPFMGWQEVNVSILDPQAVAIGMINKKL